MQHDFELNDKITICADSSSDVMDFAVSELKANIKERLTINYSNSVTFDQKNAVPASYERLMFVLCSNQSPLAGASIPAELGDGSIDGLDSYKISSESSGSGAEQKSKVTIAGANDRAVLHGIYAFMKMNKFFNPYPDFDFLPEELKPTRHRNEFLLCDAQKLVIPAFRFRSGLVSQSFKPGDATTSANHIIKTIDWMAKNGMNTVALNRRYYLSGSFKDIFSAIKERGMRLTVEGHGPMAANMQEHIDNAMKDIGLIDPPLDEIIRPVPDYQGLWGKDESSWGMTDSNGNVIPEFFGNAEAGATLADKQLYLMQKVSEAIMAEKPQENCKSVAIAYQDFLPAPSQSQAASGYDGIVYMCPINRSYRDSLFNPNSASNTNADILGALENWVDQNKGYGENMVLYSYYTKMNWSSLPVNTPQLMADELLACKARGFLGAHDYMPHDDWLSYLVQHYMFAWFLSNLTADDGSTAAVAEAPWQQELRQLYSAMGGLDAENYWIKQLVNHMGTFENQVCKAVSGNNFFSYAIRGMGGSNAATASSRIAAALEAIEGENGLIAQYSKYSGTTASMHRLCALHLDFCEHWAKKLEAAKELADMNRDEAAFLAEIFEEDSATKGYLNYLAALENPFVKSSTKNEAAKYLSSAEDLSKLADLPKM